VGVTLFEGGAARGGRGAAGGRGRASGAADDEAAGDAGRPLPGLDLATLLDAGAYHTARDEPGRIRPGTLQARPRTRPRGAVRASHAAGRASARGRLRRGVGGRPHRCRPAGRRRKGRVCSPVGCACLLEAGPASQCLSGCTITEGHESNGRLERQRRRAAPQAMGEDVAAAAAEFCRVLASPAARAPLAASGVFFDVLGIRMVRRRARGPGLFGMG